MKRNVLLTLLVASLLGCAEPLLPRQSAVTETSQVPQTNVVKLGSDWSIYDPDPARIWNRVFRHLFQRTSVDGYEYGFDELDPLLWFDTTYLLQGNPHVQTIKVLDEFLGSHAENQIRDPLKRAMFQHDLWAVFDSLAWRSKAGSR